MGYIMTKDGWMELSAAVVCVNHNRIEGCFRSTSLEEAQKETGYRADMYARDVAAYISGNLRKERIFDAFAPPMYGAFGEKL